MAKKRSQRKGPEGSADLVTVMLTLERPSPEELRGYGRGDKYAALKSSASEIRKQLLAWIREQGLDEDVTRVGEPTVFNTLFVTSTRAAAKKLGRAPGVVEVRPAEGFRVDLLPNLRDSPPGKEPAGES
jgi:hypothetical protein